MGVFAFLRRASLDYVHPPTADVFCAVTTRKNFFLTAKWSIRGNNDVEMPQTDMFCRKPTETTGTERPRHARRGFAEIRKFFKKFVFLVYADRQSVER
jgi:hypothetical protein